MGKDVRPTRILLAESLALFREAVRSALEAEEDLLVVGAVGDGVQAIVEVHRARPDVVVLDADLPRGDGISVARAIKDRVSECNVLILANRADLDDLLRSCEAGASGYLTKDSGLPDLIEAVRAIHAGETVVPPQMLGALLARLIRRRRDQDEALRQLGTLTRREREILALLARGSDNVAIARALVISPQTARTHIQHILTKLGMHSRLEAASYARRTEVLDELLRSSPTTFGARRNGQEGRPLLVAVDGPR